MATLNFVPLPLIEQIAKAGIDAAVGVIDVKSYYIETPDDVAAARAGVPEVCAAGAAGVRARLRLEPDRSLGGTTEARQHGRGRSPRPQGAQAVTLIEPVLSGDALTADIEAADPGDGLVLWWLGQSGFLVKSAAGRVLFDPYLSDSLTRKYEHTDKPHVRMTASLAIPPGQASRDRRRHLEPQSHGSPRRRDAPRPCSPRILSAAFVIPEANRAFVADRVALRSGRGRAGSTMASRSPLATSRFMPSRLPTTKSSATQMVAAATWATSSALGGIDHLPQRRHAALSGHGGAAAAVRGRRRALADQRQPSRAARRRQSVRRRSRAACPRHRRTARDSLPLRHVRVQHRVACPVRRNLPIDWASRIKCCSAASGSRSVGNDF